MKLYMITWGYYSDHNSGDSWDSIWTTREKALASIKVKLDYLTHLKSHSKALDTWTDGDYWISISEIEADSDFPYDQGPEK